MALATSPVPPIQRWNDSMQAHDLRTVHDAVAAAKEMSVFARIAARSLGGSATSESTATPGGASSSRGVSSVGTPRDLVGHLRAPPSAAKPQTPAELGRLSRRPRPLGVSLIGTEPATEPAAGSSPSAIAEPAEELDALARAAEEMEAPWGYATAITESTMAPPSPSSVLGASGCRPGSSTVSTAKPSRGSGNSGGLSGFARPPSSQATPPGGLPPTPSSVTMPPLAQASPPTDRSSDSSAVRGFGIDSTSGSLSQDSDEDTWPPKEPVMRFKMLSAFLNRYDPHDSAVIRDGSRDARRSGKTKIIHDATLSWFNKTFDMAIDREFDLEVGFPVVMLTLMDVVHPSKVPWHHIDWDFHSTPWYKKAVQKNYDVLAKIWREVNMVKAKGFRPADTALRLEMMPQAKMSDKLDFLRRARAWFETGTKISGLPNQVARRLEYTMQCEAKGFKVNFPEWMTHEEPTRGKRVSMEPSSNQKAYDALPEFKRLILFLGSSEHQKM